MPYDDIFDISHWQDLPKMGAAKAAGFDAVIIKATEGTGSIRPLRTTGRRREIKIFFAAPIIFPRGEAVSLRRISS